MIKYFKGVALLLLVLLMTGCFLYDKEDDQLKDTVIICTNDGDDVVVEAHSEVVFEKATYKIISGKLDFIFDYKDQYTEEDLARSKDSLKNRFCGNSDSSMYPALDCSFDIEGTKLIVAAELDPNELAVRAIEKENDQIQPSDFSKIEEYMQYLFGNKMICEKTFR